jgi:hypothetical protein
LRSAPSTEMISALSDVADLDELLGVFHALVGELADVDKSLDAALDLDEGAEVEHLEDLAIDDLARRIIVRECDPMDREPAA